jgi:predicted AlkP superfamily phosphohydrolase/phosphomutase
MPSWSALFDSGLDDESGSDPDPGVAERAVTLASRVGVTSQRLGAVLDRLHLYDLVVDHVPTSVIRAGTEQVSFPDSRAYMRSRIELGVRLNVEGREPNGVVPESEYESVRVSIIEALRSVTAPDGTPVFQEVAPREAYFHGPEADNAVDIVTVPTNFDHFLSSSLRGEQFGQPSEPWNHKLDGVFTAFGDGVDHNANVESAHLFDVAPTVLATLGVPQDERMDGNVFECVDAAGVSSYPRLTAGETVETDDRTVESHLSDLGYIE